MLPRPFFAAFSFSPSVLPFLLPNMALACTVRRAHTVRRCVTAKQVILRPGLNGGQQCVAACAARNRREDAVEDVTIA